MCLVSITMGIPNSGWLRRSASSLRIIVVLIFIESLIGSVWRWPKRLERYAGWKIGLECSRIRRGIGRERSTWKFKMELRSESKEAHRGKFEFISQWVWPICRRMTRNIWRSYIGNHFWIQLSAHWSFDGCQQTHNVKISNSRGSEASFLCI